MTVLRVPAVAICSLAVIVGGGTLAMLEPVLSLHLAASLDLGPARIGLVFGLGAILAMGAPSAVWSTRRSNGWPRADAIGLAGIGAFLPVYTLPRSFAAAAAAYALGVLPITLLVTPSLAYIAEASASTGARSNGVAYGVY